MDANAGTGVKGDDELESGNPSQGSPDGTHRTPGIASTSVEEKPKRARKPHVPPARSRGTSERCPARNKAGNRCHLVPHGSADKHSAFSHTW